MVFLVQHADYTAVSDLTSIKVMLKVRLCILILLIIILFITK
jgi:hypothetical protein